MKTETINYWVSGFCAASALYTGLHGNYASMTIDILLSLINLLVGYIISKDQFRN